MDAWVWIVIAVVLILLVGGIGWAVTRQRRSTRLREQFGPEYDRTVGLTDSRREAESELAARRERRAGLDIQPLTASSRARYAEAWRGVQSGFVDDPAASLIEADRLVLIVMRERGYPVDDFEQRAADISVDHPVVVEHYRAAHAISERTNAQQADTEDMRQGLVHYRALFEDLLGVDEAQLREAREA